MSLINNIEEAFNRAKEFFVEGCEVYFVTSDGNVFLLENKHFAYNHAAKQIGKNIQVFEVKKEIEEPIEKPIKKRRGRKKLDNGTT